MNRKWKPYIAAAICAIAAERAWAQAPQFVTLTIEYANGVVYGDIVGDPLKFATSPTPLDLSASAPKNFVSFLAIGDIASVNGVPVKGAIVDRGRTMMLSSAPNPGQAIADLGRGALVDIILEIRQTDGTAIGTIMTSGFTGGAAPPGAPAGVFLNMAVTGGTGAFLGARGYMTSPNLSFRLASMQEDPSSRRANGGSRGIFTVYLMPLLWPQIVSTPNGPAILHASDFSPVTAAKPAKSGEDLTLYATGLGPTRPALEPGKVFSANPLQVANSPIEVTVGGQPAEVLYAGGYPGTTDGFQVNFRMPSGLTPGMSSLQLTSAFIPGGVVSISIQ